MPRRALHLALVVLAAAVTGSWLRPAPLPTLAVCLGLLAAGLLFLRRPPSDEQAQRFALRFLLAALFCLALAQQGFVHQREALAQRVVEGLGAESMQLLRGRLADEPALDQTDTGAPRLRATLKRVEVADPATGAWRPLPGRLRLAAYRAAARQLEALGPPHRGQALELRLRLLPLPPRAHPDLFDYGAYLRSHQVCARGLLLQTGGARRLPEYDAPLESAFFGALMAWRRATLERIERALPDERGALVRAMLLGETGDLSDATRRDFVRIGSAHLFAVSGLHTGLLALLCFGLLRLAGVGPRPGALATLAAMLLFAALVGFRPPVLRATMMAAALTLPLWARRGVDTLNALGLAALLTMLADPRAPFRADFQLSYLSAFGIVALGPALRELLGQDTLAADPDQDHRSGAVVRFLRGGLSVSIAAQLATLPFVVQYFHLFSPLGLLSNLLLVPLAAPLVGLAWVYSLLGGLGPFVESLLAPPLALAAGGFLALARALAAVPGAALYLPPLPWWLGAAYYLLLFGGATLRLERWPGALERRRAALLLRLTALAALVVLWPLAARLPLPGAGGPPLRLTMLDVGQGDCTLLELPDGRTIVIDTGVGGVHRSVLDYLHARGSGAIEALILTHDDKDHSGGADELIAAAFVDRVLVGPEHPLAGNPLGLALERHGVARHRVARGDRLRVAPAVAIDFLHPDPEGRYDEDNARSLVIRIRYGQTVFLLPGDLERQGEGELLAALGPRALDADVLKAGHHGSAGSSSMPFLRAVSPRVALISAGRHNRYGHPAPETLERLARLGDCQVFQTPLHGTVELESDGRRIRLRPSRRPVAPLTAR